MASQYLVVWLGLAVAALLAFGPSDPALSNDRHAATVSLDGVINATNAQYLSRGIERATDDGAELLVVRLNTPGGSLKATRAMVDSLLNSEIPVVVHVTPPGAHAASAGTFIAAAANFAVMEPGTNIGAASPVAGSGRDLPPTLGKKINEDTRAFIRSIAEVRGRNAQALEATVTHALSYSATEAADLGVVDFVASGEDLMARLDGLTAETAAGLVTLDTEGLESRAVKRTWLEHLLGAVSKPNVALSLASLGFLLIVLEFLVPGWYAPSALGTLLLVLVLAGAGSVPVTWLGIACIALGVFMFVMEAHVYETEYNAMGIGGVLAFVVGLFLTFGGFFSTPDIPEVGTAASIWLLLSVSVFFIVLVWAFLRVARVTGGANSAYVSDLQRQDPGLRLGRAEAPRRSFVEQ